MASLHRVTGVYGILIAHPLGKLAVAALLPLLVYVEVAAPADDRCAALYIDERSVDGLKLSGIAGWRVVAREAGLAAAEQYLVGRELDLVAFEGVGTRSSGRDLVG